MRVEGLRRRGRVPSASMAITIYLENLSRITKVPLLPSVLVSQRPEGLVIRPRVHAAVLMPLGLGFRRFVFIGCYYCYCYYYCYIFYLSLLLLLLLLSLFLLFRPLKSLRVSLKSSLRVHCFAALGFSVISLSCIEVWA